MMRQQLVACVHCGGAAHPAARPECDGCWELRRRIDSDPTRARYFQARVAFEPGSIEALEQGTPTPDRELVLSLALAAMVPETNWRHPAQADAVVEAGRFFALLVAGCEVRRESRNDSSHLLGFIVKWRGADWHAGAKHDEETFWLPRPSLLAAAPGADWYSHTAGQGAGNGSSTT